MQTGIGPKVVISPEHAAEAASYRVALITRPELIYGEWVGLHDTYRHGDGYVCPICMGHLAETVIALWSEFRDGKNIVAGYSCDVCGWALPFPPSVDGPYLLADLWKLLDGIEV